MTKPWRFRRCPRCQVVNRASAFGYVGTYRPGWHEEEAARSCPSCGHIADTSAFRVVREQHPNDPPYRDYQLMLPVGRKETDA